MLLDGRMNPPCRVRRFASCARSGWRAPRQHHARLRSRNPTEDIDQLCAQAHQEIDVGCVRLKTSPHSTHVPALIRTAGQQSFLPD
jgi:hypothetical protein